MKIIQVSAIDVTMNGLLRELNEQTLAVGYELVCICSDGPYVEQMNKDGFNVKPIHIDRDIKPISNLKSIYQMVKLFRREKPDIVHVHTPVAAILGRVAAKLARVPVIIYTAHGFYFHENMPPRTYKKYFWIEKIAAKLFTDYIFTQSEEDGQLAKEEKFLPKDRITVISNGVDVQGKFNPDLVNRLKVKELKQEFEIKPETKVITFIGRLVKEKGVFELLEAFNRLEQDNIRLLIVGSAGKSERDQESVKELEKYKMNENIVFAGYRSDIPEILALTDVFCLPSYREGMPRSIIEAMAMECAIIATDIRGSREEVDHEKNGLLVKLKSVDELTDAFDTILSNDKLLLNYKEYSRKKAIRLYDEKKVVQKQLEIFEKVKG